MSAITPQHLLAWTGGSVASGTLHACSGVFTDSRSPLVAGLFVALTGERFDGHDYIALALNAGASGAVVTREQLAKAQSQLESSGRDAFLIAVDNTLTALHGLARGHRCRFTAPVVAITGSNGKTTTKEMTAACFGVQVPVLATHKNYNNEIGLPLTLLGLKPEHGACVVEIAMRGLGQIAQLSAVALPDVAVVTNVGPVHLATLGSIENVALAKSELVRALSPKGIAVLNADDPHVAAMAGLAAGEVFTYGILGEARFQARHVVADPQGSTFELWVDGTLQTTVRVSLPGRHNVYNALAALAATQACRFDLDMAISALAKLPPPPMRLEISHLTSNITLVNDAYNASPLSMRSALEVLAILPAKRRVAVLGDMLELGAEHEIQHKLVGRLVAEANVGLLLTVGEGGRLIASGAQEAGLPAEDCKWYLSAAEAAADVASWMQRDDCILIKASRGMRLEQVAESVANAAKSHVEG